MLDVCPVGHPAQFIIDAPLGFAFSSLDDAHQYSAPTIVVTHNLCPEYLEDLWELHPTVLLAGDYVLDDLQPALLRALRAERARLTPGEPTRLTPAERRLLGKLARGWSTKEIAAAQELEPKTVCNHISLLCKKLHVPDRTAAALYYWGHRMAGDSA